VTIGDLHAKVDLGPFRARGLVLYGTLENAGAVSNANRTLSKNLNVKRTAVGSAALGWFVEAGYDLFSLFGISNGTGLDLFGRYEYYDSQYRVADGAFDNPRWERSVWTAGLNYRLHPDLIFKGQYSSRRLGLPSDNMENTLSMGFGIVL
jgi:hypothetical protein